MVEQLLTIEPNLQVVFTVTSHNFTLLHMVKLLHVSIFINLAPPGHNKPGVTLSTCFNNHLVGTETTRKEGSF